jgi:hypothetical protein
MIAHSLAVDFARDFTLLVVCIALLGFRISILLHLLCLAISLKEIKPLCYKYTFGLSSDTIWRRWPGLLSVLPGQCFGPRCQHTQPPSFYRNFDGSPHNYLFHQGILPQTSCHGYLALSLLVVTISRDGEFQLRLASGRRWWGRSRLGSHTSTQRPLVSSSVMFGMIVESCQHGFAGINRCHHDLAEHLEQSRTDLKKTTPH